jgi:signal transduction histidine kinase
MKRLASNLNSSDQNKRMSAISSLKQLGGSQAITTLIEALQSRYSDVRWRAADVLGQIGDKRAVRALVGALKDEDVTVRMKSADALGSIGGNEAVSALIKALKDKDSSVRNIVALSLTRLSNNAAVIGAMISVLKSKDSTLHPIVAEALINIGGARVVVALANALKNSKDFQRRAIADVLGQIGDKRAVGALVDALKSEDASLSSIVTNVLSRLNNQRVKSALADALNTQNDAERLRIRNAIDRIGNEREVADFFDRLEDVGREKALEETRAFIAHEVKSSIGPLRIVAKKLIEILDQTDLDRDRLLEYAKQILEDTDIAYDVVEQYVNYTKPLMPTLRLVDINQLLRESLNEMRAQCEHNNIFIVEELGEIKKKLLIDRSLFAQALRNIFLNAIEAIGSDGKLIIITRQELKRVTITISDTGPGIKRHHLKRVFDLGFTTKMGKQGAGLGLTLVRRIIEEGHNGQIKIANNAGTTGAFVRISLPTY